MKTLLKLSIKFFQKNGFFFAFIIAVIATIGSFYYSEVLRYAPCKLCWYQRIFMYPLVLIFGIALYTNDHSIKKYVFPISTIGFLIALYHVLYQFYPAALSCSDDIASCAKGYTNYFGFLTIPMMSLLAFLLIIIFTALQKERITKSIKKGIYN